MKLIRTASALLMVLFLAAGAFAQSRGNLRITGKVTDQGGAPVGDVQIRAAKKGEAQPEVLSAKTNDKGEYTLKGMAAGEWVIEAAKEGVGVTEITTTVAEGERNKTVDITIAPKVDPNVELQTKHAEALQLAQGGKITEARKMYEELIAKYPDVYQLHAMIGNLYAAESNAPKAIEHLDIALAKEPENTDWQLLKAEVLMESGDKEGATKLLESIDITKAKEPRAFINLAINNINDKKHDEAIDLLTRLHTQFPDDATILYYRGKAYVAAMKLPEAKADFEKFVAVAPPAASAQVADAKKLLEQIDKK